MTSTPPTARRPLAAALVWGVCAAVDGLFASGEAALYGGGLGFLIGGLAGLAWWVAGGAVGRLPRAARALPWLGLGLGLGGWLIDALGALSRLEGPHRGLALAAIGGAWACGLGSGLLLAGLQPDESRPQGRLGEGRWRWVTLVGLPVVAGALLWVDRTRFVGLYPEAHTALRAMALLGLTAAACMVRWRPPPMAPVASVAVGVALGLSAFFALHDGDEQALAQMVERPLTGMTLDLARALSDVDRDGASSLLGGGDADPFAAPTGAEPAPAAVVKPAEVSGPPPTSVVLITVDTLRPDRMSLYGHDRPTTPAIDAFAAGGLRFDRAISPGGWTSLAISGLMRGVGARKLRWTKVVETSDFGLHRWRDRDRIDRALRLRMMFGLPLDDPRPTLAERLRARGMHTMAAVDDGYSQFLSPAMGADRGFADFREVDGLPRARRDDAGTTDLALAALEARPAGRRFFLWVHYFGPHDPTRRRAGVPWFADDVPGGYDHEVRFADAQVGRLLEGLGALGADEPVTVMIASDHGELFFEKRRMHGLALQPAVVRIPLVMVGPGIPAGVVEAPASLLDVHATVLALTGTPEVTPLDGIDLRRVAAERPRRVLFSDTWRYDRQGRPVYDQVGATDGRHLLRLDRVRNLRVVWDLDDRSSTPADRRGAVAVEHLERALDGYLEATGGGRVILVE